MHNKCIDTSSINKKVYTSSNLLLNLRSPRDCGSCRPSCRSGLWYFLSPLDGASVREAHCAQASTAVPCAQASTAVRFSARSALRAGYWPTCLTDGHMVVNDHTRSAENWKCVWYFLRPIDGSSACARCHSHYTNYSSKRHV